MKFISYLIPVCILVTLVLLNRQPTNIPTDNHNASAAFITQLADKCHQHWLEQEWIINEQLAQSNTAFANGIQNICQARAELFFEGYEISPFIAPDSQDRIFPIVFLATTEEIKTHLKTHIPKLRVI